MSLHFVRESTQSLLERRNQLLLEVQERPEQSSFKNEERGVRANSNTIDGKSSSSIWQKKQDQYYTVKLDESIAKIILNYIEERKIIPKRNVSSSSSFASSNLSLIGKMAEICDILTVEKVMTWKKEDLLNYGFTIEIMIKECGISITDLWKCGVTRNLNDLIDFKFKLTDMAIHDTLFNVRHLYQHFQLNYPTLVEAKFPITIQDLIKAQFSTFELQTFSFSFDDFITRQKMRKEHFIHLKQQTFRDFIDLGLTKNNLLFLGISIDEAIEIFQCTPEDLISLS